MLALLGSLLGLLGALAPRVIQFFENKSNHRQEIELIEAHAIAELKLAEVRRDGKIAELQLTTDTQRDLAAFQASLRPSGIRFVDAANGLVRPLLTFSFFLLYALVKAATWYVFLDAGTGFTSITNIWSDEDTAIWACIVTFWFGNRSLNVRR